LKFFRSLFMCIILSLSLMVLAFLVFTFLDLKNELVFIVLFSVFYLILPIYLLSKKSTIVPSKYKASMPVFIISLTLVFIFVIQLLVLNLVLYKLIGHSHTQVRK
jgi:hypothetical protein